MKNFLPALFTFLSLMATAQEQTSFEIRFSPNLTDHTKKISDNKGKIGYDLGVLLALPINIQRLEGIVGLELSTFGYKNEVDKLRWGSQHNGNGGFDPNAPSGPIYGVKFKQNQYFVQVPIGLRYYLSYQKLKVYLQPTLAPAMFLTNQTKVEYIMDGPNKSNASWGGYTGIRKYNIIAGLGIGLVLPISEKIGIGIQPHGGIQLLPMVNDSATGARLYSAGLDLAFRYRFY